MISSFEKGLAGRGGWREEILPMPESQTFSVPFFYATLRRRGTEFRGSIPSVFGPCYSPTPFRQPLFETSEIVKMIANHCLEDRNLLK